MQILMSVELPYGVNLLSFGLVTFDKTNNAKRLVSPAVVCLNPLILHRHRSRWFFNKCINKCAQISRVARPPLSPLATLRHGPDY